MASSGKVVIPIFLLVSIVCTVSVIYGALEMSDGERSALEVLQDLISGKLSLKDIWNALTGKDGEESCAGPDTNGVYELDAAGNCIKKGCKPGYFEQGGICLKQRDLSDDVYNGEADVDCEISGYTLGECLNERGDVLTGDMDRCGPGTRQKYPKVINGGIGVGSGCDNKPINEDCEVTCPLECDAPESLYVPVEGAYCMGNGKKLGVPIDVGGGVEVTYHGEGLLLKRLLGVAEIPEELISGFSSAQDYADSINYSACVNESQKGCKIESTETSKFMGCELPGTGIGWITHKNGTVYTKDSVDAFMADPSKFGDLEILSAVSREDAKVAGVLDDNYQEIEGSDNMPKGYMIQYKASNEIDTDTLQQGDCTIIGKIEANAPRAREDCVIDDIYSDCFSVGCGAKYNRTVTPTMKKPAWGGGGCNLGSAYIDTSSCETREASCCDERFVGAWEKVEGYQGCVADNGTMKRQYTRIGNGNLCSNSNVKYENDDSCNYIEGVVKVVLTSSFSKGDDSTSMVPYMLFNYIDSSGTTHNTSKIKNNATETFATPVKLTFIQGGLYYNGSKYNLYGAATQDSVLDVKVYGENDVLLKSFRKVYPLGHRTHNAGGHFTTDKPGSEDWDYFSENGVPLQW